MDEPAERAEDASSPSDGDFFSNILAPGSSLNPTFLLVVDVVLALLSLTLGSLVIVTGGNVHLIALFFITLALWASIKWFVNELQRTLPPSNTSQSTVAETKKSE